LSDGKLDKTVEFVVKDNNDDMKVVDVVVDVDGVDDGASVISVK
jgi:hypothetical protein